MNDDYDNAHDDKSALAKHTPAPPEVPAWAVKAAEAIIPSQSVFDVEYRAHVVERVSATIARHAPTPAPATDYAELLKMDDDVEILLSVRSGWTRKDKERALNRLLCRQACPPPAAARDGVDSAYEAVGQRNDATDGRTSYIWWRTPMTIPEGTTLYIKRAAMEGTP